MVFSHLIEKLKIGKRFVLLDLVVHPDEGQNVESAGSHNKGLSRECWHLIYQRLGEICRKHFGEIGSDGVRSRGVVLPLDQAFEFRLDPRPTIRVSYEFRDSNQRDVINGIFTENDRKLHKHCLYVQIWDDSRKVYEDLKESQMTVERLQRENQRLRTVPEASQEYTPTPLGDSSGDADHPEYIPTTLNGTSPQQPSYKAAKIDSLNRSAKKVPKIDQYTPISSQDSVAGSGDNIEYTPTVCKSEKNPAIALQDGEDRIETNQALKKSAHKRTGFKRNTRRSELFGSDDEDKLTTSREPASVKTEDDANHSVDNIFGEESPSKPFDTSSIEIPDSTSTGTDGDGSQRSKLPRKTKDGIKDYRDTLMAKPEKNPFSLHREKMKSNHNDDKSTHRREKSSKSSSSKLSSSKPGSCLTSPLTGWLEKKKRAASPTSLMASPQDSHQQENDNHGSKRHRKDTKEKDKETKHFKDKKQRSQSPQPQQVDFEKLRKEEEAMRKTMANLDKLDKMLPEDKSALDVPVLDCCMLTLEEIQDSFDEFRDDLRRIYDHYKDKSERHWQQAEELCYFTEVTSVFNDEQKYAMLMRLENEFVPEECRGQYTEFFTSTLSMEWALRLWMKKFNFKSRRAALDRIQLQEEANPLELTPTFLASLTVSTKKKR
ncbi:uncharacterized protein LOC129738666 [Uranotaenia lowii]|uniref:uncharacterized protein LOC129738666 n=1 Tax=Uranotaenia lowii TaxID=190385 RepID=UPI002478E0B3|nr:uncharacterized protein LOC129738666 [Uranotaenia lowii]